MQRAIRNLIKDRKLEDYAPLVVDVDYIGGRPIGKCGENAADEKDLHKNPDGTSPVKVVSGWLVGDWNGIMSPVLPHFWNYDERTEKFYDTTDGGYFKDIDGVTYVCDNEVWSMMHKSHGMKWDDNVLGICYRSDNKPYLLGKLGNQLLINDFTNANVKLLCEMLEKEIA